MKVKIALMSLATVALVAAGCNKPATNTNTGANTNAQTTNSNANAQANANTNTGAMMKKTSQVTMNAQNGSKQTGTVTFMSTADNKTQVSVNITSGAAGVAQPAHIHIGSCATIGAVKLALTNVVNGKSETTIDMPFATIWDALPLAVNVHKSAAEVNTYVSCGDLPA